MNRVNREQAIAAWNTRTASEQPRTDARGDMVEADWRKLAIQLAMREADYRLNHDVHGDGSREAGRSWDMMRRAGDAVRNLIFGHPTQEQPRSTEGRCYLIRKRGHWYRPNSAGYTSSIHEAGRYTLAEAEEITHPNGHDGPRDGMSYKHVSELAALRRTAPPPSEAEKLLREAKRRADLIAIVEQGCGGTFTYKEMAESAMKQAQELSGLIDAALSQGSPDHD